MPTKVTYKDAEPEVDLNAESTIQAVWEKGKAITGYDKDEWRRDKDDYPIKRVEHGNRGSKYGWEIDHIKLVSDGGKDVMSNLRPLYWKTNASRQGS